jgi:hypothetical protein
MVEYSNKKGGTAVLEKAEVHTSVERPEAFKFDEGENGLPENSEQLSIQDVFRIIRSSAPVREGPVIFSSLGEDRKLAEKLLLEAPDPVFLRLAGGCFGTRPQDLYIHDVLRGAFVDHRGDGYEFKGVATVGGSEARLKGAPHIIRPCFPDIGPVLERMSPQARFMATFPGHLLTQEAGQDPVIYRDKADGKEYYIYVNPAHKMCMFGERVPGYFWDGETELVSELESSLNELRPFRVSAYLFFEGRRGVAGEIRRVAAESKLDTRKKLILITGGHPDSAPDRFARDRDFLREYKDSVQVVSASAGQVLRSALRLRKALIDLQVFSRADETFSLSNESI